MICICINVFTLTKMPPIFPGDFVAFCAYLMTFAVKKDEGNKHYPEQVQEAMKEFIYFLQHRMYIMYPPNAAVISTYLRILYESHNNIVYQDYMMAVAIDFYLMLKALMITSCKLMDSAQYEQINNVSGQMSGVVFMNQFESLSFELAHKNTVEFLKYYNPICPICFYYKKLCNCAKILEQLTQNGEILAIPKDVADVLI
jgi:hypothetical protein